jgi:hypothetical protein
MPFGNHAKNGEIIPMIQETVKHQNAKLRKARNQLE